MPTDSDIDRLLREAAEQWRSGIAINRDVEARTFLGAQRPHFGRIAAASLGLFASVAVFSVLIASRSVPTGDTSGAVTTPPGAVSTPSTSQRVVDSNSLIVAIGDTVVATGAIGIGSTGTVYLCPGEFSSRGGALGCRGGQLVQVSGVDGRVWGGRSVTTRGTWTGEVVQVAEISPAEPITPTAPGPVPCDPPAGGWPGNAPSDAAEVAGHALEKEVRQHPEAYVGLWPAVAANASQGITDPVVITDRVVVVGTVDDVEAVRSRLARLYPFNLCVVPVEFSASELESVVGQLSAVDPSWLVEIEPRLDRVVVTTTALDAAGYAQLVPVLEKVELRVTVKRVH
jgi:hypothetical protein